MWDTQHLYVSLSLRVEVDGIHQAKEQVLTKQGWTKWQICQISDQCIPDIRLYLIFFCFFLISSVEK